MNTQRGLRSLALISALGLGLQLGPAAAQDPSEAAGPAFDSLLGSWRAECDAWGVPAHCHTQWTAGLHGDHLIQQYSITEVAGDAVLFQGRGIYRFSDGGVDGYWEDSQGSIHPLSGSWENGALTVIWGAADTEIGRSRYQLADAALTVTDWVLEESGWRSFMQVEYAQE